MDDANPAALIDSAIDNALSLLTGRHGMLMRVVSVTHSTVVSRHERPWQDDVCLVVTIVVEPYEID